MRQNGQPGENLLRVIGEDRGAHAAGEVAAAERELVERLGGTRAQARKRLKASGAFNVFFGFSLVALAAFILFYWGLEFLRDESRIPGIGEELGFCIGLGILFAFGVAIATTGVAVLRRSRWALRRARFIPFVRADDVALLAESPPLEDVLETIGAARGARAPELVAAAEEELRDRLAHAHGEHVRRVRRWAWTAIVVGGYFTLWGAAMTRALLGGPDSFPARGGGLAAVLDFWMTCWMVAATGGFGVGLLVCGLGLRRRRDWARRGLIWTLSLWYAAMLALFPLMAGSTLLKGAQAWELVILLVLTPPSIMLWVFGIRSVAKPLASAATRDVCAPSEGRPGEAMAREDRRTMRAVVTLIAVLPVFGLVLAYGVWRHKAASALRDELQELRQSGAVLDLAQWQPTPPPLADNAADAILDAAALTEAVEQDMRERGQEVPTTPDGEPLEDWGDLFALVTWTPEQAEYAQHFVSASAEALALLRQASARPRADFGWDYSGSWPILSGLSDLRRGGRLLCLSARVAQRRQDDPAALADLVAAVRLAGFPDRDPFFVVLLSRASSLALASHSCESLLRESDRRVGGLESLDTALRTSAERLDLSRAMGCERASLVTVWGDIRSGNWEAFSLAPPGRLKAFFVRPFLDSEMSEALALANAAVRHAGAPPWQAVGGMEEVEQGAEHAYAAHRWQESIAVLFPHPLGLLPAYRRGADAYADCLALVDSLRVAIALRRYAVDKGEPARALDALVPDYLPEVPRDPFSGGDLHVKRADGLVTVYSVGDNLEDDGGNLTEDPEYHTRPDTGVQIRE